MGLFSASAPAQLHPVSPPLGVYQHYCVDVPTTLVLKEKAFSWSGDDFAVKDSNGYVVVRCAAKTFSFNDSKVITDANTQPMFFLRNKLLSFHKTFVAEDAQGSEIFRIKKRFGLGTVMEATFRNASTGHEITLELRGDFWGGSADIAIVGGQTVAQISRQLWNARQIFTDKQTYFVTVAPGVDLALIAAICICFDEARNDNNR